MRIEVAVLLVAAACGGAQHGATKPVADCAEYVVAMRPPLARLARAADQFGDQQLAGLEDAAAAAKQLAAKLAEEQQVLASLDIADRKLRAAHDTLPPALSEMSAALTFLADALLTRDETQREPARQRLDAANQAWGTAVTNVRAICPID